VQRSRRPVFAGPWLAFDIRLIAPDAPRELILEEPLPVDAEILSAKKLKTPSSSASSRTHRLPG
jgi:hypothetical protein